MPKDKKNELILFRKLPRALLTFERPKNLETSKTLKWPKDLETSKK